MSTTIAVSGASGGVNLRVFGSGVEHEIGWGKVWIDRPGAYRVGLPTEDQARELERTHPGGILMVIDGRSVWMEPIDFPS